MVVGYGKVPDTIGSVFDNINIDDINIIIVFIFENVTYEKVFGFFPNSRNIKIMVPGSFDKSAVGAINVVVFVIVVFYVSTEDLGYSFNFFGIGNQIKTINEISNLNF